MNKQIRVKMGYFGEPDKDITGQAIAAVDGLTRNPNFPNPLVDLATFKTENEAYASAIAAALDGGKKAIVDRNEQGVVVIKMLRQLGHWVEANCKDDLSILKSSGFQPASTTKSPAQPLQWAGNHHQSSERSEQRPASGQGRPSRQGAVLYRALCGYRGDGKLAPWTELPPFSSSNFLFVDGLTPGTTYAFQVRALGRLGYTDWSDSVTRMSM
jgi:hypothetical protein